ncbi:MAG TPA: T9SS type A sorting domain-containing protein [Bacteroidia bacterium]
MKKIILTTFVSCLCLLESMLYGQNQTFPQTGSNIYYSIELNAIAFPHIEQGYNHSWHAGDTLINGETYRRFLMEKQTIGIYSTGPNQLDTVLGNIQNLGAKYYTSSGDTVYYFNEVTGQKTFYWYNNPQPGDIWKYIQLNPEFNTIDTAYLLVQSVDLLDLNGHPSKNINLKSTYPPGPTPSYWFSLSMPSVTINTVMGPNLNFIGFHYISPTLIIEYPFLHVESITCFTSDEIPNTFNPSNFSDCRAYVALSAPEWILNKNIHLYPNPVENELSLQNHSSSSTLTGFITDLSGRKQGINFSLNTESTTVVSLSTLQSGMYILVLKDKDGNSQTHKLIKQ